MVYRITFILKNTFIKIKIIIQKLFKLKMKIINKI